MSLAFLVVLASLALCTLPLVYMLPHWSWPHAALFTAILAPTDAVAVAAILRTGACPPAPHPPPPLPPPPTLPVPRHAHLATTLTPPTPPHLPAGAPELLCVLLEGESLFNDASAVVLFELFHELVRAFGPYGRAAPCPRATFRLQLMPAFPPYPALHSNPRNPPLPLFARAQAEEVNQGHTVNFTLNTASTIAVKICVMGGGEGAIPAERHVS